VDERLETQQKASYPYYPLTTTNSWGTLMPRKARTRKRRSTPARVPDVLDVTMAAQFLTVSPDTVYSLFQSGDLPGRKVGRKWVTTKAAVLRWIETSATDDALARAVERGDRDALAEAINRGKARVKSGRS
jgi:excisionase family DNA binding protein